MSKLLLRHIYKIYPGVGKVKKNAKGELKKRSGDFVAVKDFNMEINDGEFIVFVGPSGCGKSTTLRMIAGLEEISGGELYIDDQLVNDVDAKDRDIAMVFQSYALYPHLTAYDTLYRKQGRKPLDLLLLQSISGCFQPLYRYELLA